MPQGHRHMSEQKRQCIQDCLDCYRVCLETAAHCLQQGGEHAEAARIQLLLDCAEASQTCASFLLRGSEVHGRLCGICVEVAEQCAQACDELQDDAQMQACAETCRRCAQSCRRMA